MSNKKRKKHNELKEANADTRPSLKKVSTASKKKARDVVILIALTVIITAVYIYFVQMWQFRPVFIVYLSVWSVSVLFYCIYNRGFISKDIREENLSPYWSKEKKEQFIKSVKERREKSRWLLFIIIPITFVMIMEIFVVFVMPNITSSFQASGTKSI